MEKTEIKTPFDFEFGEYENVYLKVKDIRRGDVFYECERGENYELKALTSAQRANEGWYVIVQNKEGEKIEIYASERTTHPGPNLYREPQNFVAEKKGKIIYQIN